MAINKACKATMAQMGHNCTHALCWWTPECKAASDLLLVALSEEDQLWAYPNLKCMVKLAKHMWADQYIMSINMWEVAALLASLPSKVRRMS